MHRNAKTTNIVRRNRWRSKRADQLPNSSRLDDCFPEEGVKTVFWDRLCGDDRVSRTIALGTSFTSQQPAQTIDATFPCAKLLIYVLKTIHWSVMLFVTTWNCVIKEIQTRRRNTYTIKSWYQVLFGFQFTVLVELKTFWNHENWEFWAEYKFQHDLFLFFIRRQPTSPVIQKHVLTLELQDFIFEIQNKSYT